MRADGEPNLTLEGNREGAWGREVPDRVPQAGRRGPGRGLPCRRLPRRCRAEVSADVNAVVVGALL